MLERACTHAVGPYKYQNTDIRGFGYYTNNPPAGAYRGFGVCQSEFALESLIDLLAEKVGLDPWEIRYRNAIEPGEVLPNGQIADCSTALKETLLEVKDAYYAHPGHAGIACAMKNAGVGVGLPDAGRCKIRVENGVAVVYAATSDIGQGCNTVFLQDVAEACGLPLRCIANGECSTENAPDSGTTSGSRQTVVTGEAVRGAAFLLRDAMVGIEAGKPAPDAPVSAHGDGVKIEYDDGRAYQLHAQELVAGQGMHPQDPAAAIKALEGCEFGYVYLEPTDKLGADVPNPKSHICYGFATHVVILDDDGRVSEVYAAHDSGKVVNPISIQGQIEAACSWVWAMRLPRTGRSRTACPRRGTVRSGCSVRPRFRISTPSTWRRTSCCPWHTAARASARSRRSPRRPPYRTPTARLTASCVQICHGGYALQPRPSPWVG